ncbi:MAG: hypothetical protein JWR12_1339 [Mucilaginibacter sp.]|nr:hypothetical protein [Mucilaginibacter sp.]
MKQQNPLLLKNAEAVKSFDAVLIVSLFLRFYFIKTLNIIL